jgi:UDP-N-acetylmuramate--alanine ligase
MTTFFCGIGGSGMMPLAFILQSRGQAVAGSDRSRDQGRTPGKFTHLQQRGIRLYPQDGSGLAASGASRMIVSGAIEDSVPDVAAAKALGLPIITRPQLLAGLANEAMVSVAVAGTSGKTTVTGLIGYALQELGENPTVMNGGIFRNYSGDDPFCTALTGRPELFVTEADESDGSIALYRPSVGVLTNVSLDHKSMSELERLFGDFISICPTAVLNLDDPVLARLAARGRGLVTGFGLTAPAARLTAEKIELTPTGSRCEIIDRGDDSRLPLTLQIPGRHNILNALAALAAVQALGLALDKAVPVLAGFTGIKRRLEVVGTQNNVTVIDDFAHNPDKIAASLATLKAFPGRLLVLFQPHGFGPLRLMRRELVESFASQLNKNDQLFMPEPYYAGGTTDRSVSSQHIVADLQARGVNASVYSDRASITTPLLAAARAGDRVIIMGARDDTLSDYARELLSALAARSAAQ